MMKKPLLNFNEVIAVIGLGKNSIFTKVKKGEKIMVGSGEDSCFVRAGISLEDAKQDLGGPVAMIKKFQKRIKNKW